MKTLSTEDAIRELGKIGFDTIELDSTVGTDGDPASLTPARRADVRKIIADLGLKLTAIQGMPTPTIDDKKHAEGLERLRCWRSWCTIWIRHSRR